MNAHEVPEPILSSPFAKPAAYWHILQVTTHPFKRLRNFACIEVHPTQGVIAVYLKVNPETVQLEKGFTQDVRNIGHFGTGDLKLTMRTFEDFERAKPLLQGEL